jgi:hypothetical protein
MTAQQTYTFDNLSITRTIIDGQRFLSVDHNCGEYWEELSPNDADYSKAIILMLNKENHETV